LTKEKVRTPSPAAMLPSLSQEIKPQSNFVTSQELATIQKENPKPANIEPPMTALITGSSPEEPSAEAPKQQLAVVATSRTNNLPESKPLVVAVPKALEGYIIQLAFKDRSEARRWGDIFQQRGYAVSTTESGTAESLRVRIGNFSLRDDAERELKSIRKDGLTGIILNLPQAYRPEVHSSLP
jgi:cell division protein FtsN